MAKLLSDAQAAEIFTDRQEYRQGDTVRVGVRFSDERLAPASDEGVRIVVEDYDNRVLVGGPRPLAAPALRAAVASERILAATLPLMNFRTVKGNSS